MAKDKADIKIRRMVESDLPRVNEVDRLLFGDERVPTWPFSFEAYWRVYRPGLSFIAELEGKVVGFAVGNIIQEEHYQSIFSLRHTVDRPLQHRQVGWIDMIGIHPEYQHRGIGQSLVEVFYEECKRNNAVVMGMAKESDKRLRDFLAALGFRKSDIVTYEKD